MEPLPPPPSASPPSASPPSALPPRPPVEFGGGVTCDSIRGTPYACIADKVSAAVGATWLKRPGICRKERYRLPEYVPKYLDPRRGNNNPTFLGKRAEYHHLSGTGEEAGGGDYVPDYTWERSASALQLIRYVDTLDGEEGIRKRIFKLRQGLASLNPWRVHEHEETALHVATGGGGISRRTESERTAEMVAFIVGEEGMVEMLYMKNQHGRTPLHNMAASGFTRCFAYLCVGGFFDGINLRALLQQDERGRTVIEVARAPAEEDVGEWDVSEQLEARKAETLAILERYLDAAHPGWREAEAEAVAAARAAELARAREEARVKRSNACVVAEAYDSADLLGCGVAWEPAEAAAAAAAGEAAADEADEADAWRQGIVVGVSKGVVAGIGPSSFEVQPLWAEPAARPPTERLPLGRRRHGGRGLRFRLLAEEEIDPTTRASVQEGGVSTACTLC